MIRIIFGIAFVAFSFCLFISTFAQSAPETTRVMSYNIRYDNPGDNEDRWSNRKERLTGLIRYHAPAVFGVQEALHNQIQEIATALPQYAWYGVGRDDGKQAGEYSAIFYDKNQFDLLDKGTFWLAPDPTKPTKGWDAAIVRICSWVKLKNKNTDNEFYHFNTHFDHKGVQARENSATLILQQIRRIAGDAPVVLTGDFNSETTTPAYRNLLAGNRLRDARTVAQNGHYGPNGSFSGFDLTNKLGESPIDFIFVTSHFNVTTHAILTDSQNGKYPSDHLPVVAEVYLKK